MNVILKQFKEKYNINKPLEKLNIIYTINNSMKEKKFAKIVIEKYINKEKAQDLSNINNMFKYLNTIFMIFIQFFLKRNLKKILIYI